MVSNGFSASRSFSRVCIQTWWQRDIVTSSRIVEPARNMGFGAVDMKYTNSFDGGAAFFGSMLFAYQPVRIISHIFCNLSSLHWFSSIAMSVNIIRVHIRTHTLQYTQKSIHPDAKPDFRKSLLSKMPKYERLFVKGRNKKDTVFKKRTMALPTPLHHYNMWKRCQIVM